MFLFELRRPYQTFYSAVVHFYRNLLYFFIETVRARLFNLLAYISVPVGRQSFLRVWRYCRTNARVKIVPESQRLKNEIVLKWSENTNKNNIPEEKGQLEISFSSRTKIHLIPKKRSFLVDITLNWKCSKCSKSWRNNLVVKSWLWRFDFTIQFSLAVPQTSLLALFSLISTHPYYTTTTTLRQTDKSPCLGIQVSTPDTVVKFEFKGNLTLDSKFNTCVKLSEKLNLRTNAN